MMERKKDTPGDSELRQLAEKKLDMDGSKTESLTELSPEEMANQLHELQVYQIELKMQNDELRRIHEELEESRSKYSHLYDFAPIGYFTVTEKGIINEVNLTLASMLGVTRTALLGQPFSRFVLKEDQDIFYKHRQRLLETEVSQACELSLVKKSGDMFYARLECITIKKDNDLGQIRTAVSDITEGKRVENELQESKALIEAVVENVPLMIFLKESTDLRFVILNGCGSFGTLITTVLGSQNLPHFLSGLFDYFKVTSPVW